MSEEITLELETLFADLPGLPRSFASLYYEALLLCLEYHVHVPGVECGVYSLEAPMAKPKLLWSGSLDDRIRRAWGAAANAIADAAVGMAYLITPLFTEYTVIECANVGDGIDYWLGLKSEANQLTFQRRGRLEVSGILDSASRSRVTQRVREKLEQTKRSDYTGLPAYVVVAEFSAPLVVLEKRE